MIRSSCLALALLLLPLDPAAAGMPRLELDRSALLTQGEPDVPFGTHWSPRLIETEDGYCAGWFDTRQGELAMVARIDRTGALLDPFGIPLAGSSADWQFELISRNGRCMAIHGSGGFVMGTSIAAEGSPEPVSKALLTPGAPWQVTEADGELALVSAHHRRGLQLTLIDADGEIVWTHFIYTDYYQLKAVIRDTTAYVLVQPGDRTGTLTLWTVDAAGASPVATEVISSEINHWGVVDEGDSFLVIDLNPANEGGPVRLDRITETGETLASWFPQNVPPAFDIKQAWREDDGSVRVLMTAQAPYLLEVRGESTDVELIPESREVAMAGSPPLSIWQEAGQLRYGFGLPATGPGQALTAAKRFELVADAAATPEGIVVVWVEWSTTGSQSLMTGVLDPEDLTLSNVETLTEGQVLGGPGDSGNPVRAAVSAKGDQVQFAWIEGTELKTRRRHVDGSWLGGEQTISTDALALDADGLTAVDDGWFLAWVDCDDCPYGSRLRGAWIGDDWTIEMADLPPLLHEGYASRAAAVMVGGNLVIVATAVRYEICEFLCPEPNFDVGALLATETGEWSTVQNFGSSLHGPPAVAANGEQLLIADSWETEIFDLSGGAFVSTHQFGDYSPHYSRALGWREGFVVASRDSPHWQGRSAATRIATLRDSGEARIEVTIADAAWLDSFHFVPVLVEWNGTIYLISSEVSLVPEEGTVRRLRAYELEPTSGRRRATRRR